VLKELQLSSIDLATKMPYRDASTCIRNLIHLTLSKTRIHAYVQESTQLFTQVNERIVQAGRFSVFMAGGTKTHGLHGAKNELNVIIGYMPEKGVKQLIRASVKAWDAMGDEVKLKQMACNEAALIADGEKVIRRSLQTENMSFQLCNQHAIREVSYKLWLEHMPKPERDKILKRLKQILYACRNSVKKHLIDGDKRSLAHRIAVTLKELDRLATRLKKRGYRSTYGFIKNSANYMVTYAKPALKAQRIPCDINRMERLMGEVAKRCKNRWAHWSPTGLENIADILLVRYTNPNLYASILRNPYTENATITSNEQLTAGRGEF
jgi:hypothetical protein